VKRAHHRAERQEARDPSTPPERLAALMEHHLDAVLDNPALELVLLAHPDFWAALTVPARAALARSPRCPHAFARWALDARDLTYPLMHNAALPARLRREALFRRESWNQWWSEARRGLQDVLPPDEAALLDRSMAAVKGGPYRTRLGLSEAEFEALVGLGHLGAAHGCSALDCPPALLARFALAPCADHRVPALAQSHPSLPAEALAEALDRPELRFGAASNPGMTAAQFDAALAEPELFEPLARNPGLPAPAARQLARLCSGRALLSLARNPALPADVQVTLAQSPDLAVREALRRRSDLAAEARVHLNP
jgi:hypothetical protein